MQFLKSKLFPAYIHVHCIATIVDEYCNLKSGYMHVYKAQYGTHLTKTAVAFYLIKNRIISGLPGRPLQASLRNDSERCHFIT